MDYPDCLLCKSHKATQTNSHVVPSFIIARACSYDGKGKRDQEVVFTISPLEEKLYLGRGLPDTKIEEIIDTDLLTEDRITNELGKNPTSKDYIFCPRCESALSMLESPYADYFKFERHIAPDIAYFFWISIVWRMSVSGQWGFELRKDIEGNLGNCLHEYLDSQKDKKDGKHIIYKCNTTYRLIRCPNALLEGKFFMADYSIDPEIITLLLGDVILCATFNGRSLDNYSFSGLEKIISTAQVNDGIQIERFEQIDESSFKVAIERMVKEKTKISISLQKELADLNWTQVGLPGKMPDEIFTRLMQNLLSDDVRIGDMGTKEHYVEVFNQTMEQFGYCARD